MKPRQLVTVAILSLGLVSAGVVRAALSSATGARVSFTALGPAGMKIEGSTTDLSVSDDGDNVVITVPLSNLSTGIGLRDRHMKEKYLEVPKYPSAVLTVPRRALTLPHGDEKLAADIAASVQLHGQTRAVTVHCVTKGEGASIAAEGGFRVNMNEFGISVPTYLGVTVKPDVDVSASFRVTGG